MAGDEADRPARVIEWLKRPGAQLVVGALVLAIAFPARASGAIGLAVLAGAVGVAAALAWPTAPDWLRAPPDRAATVLVLAVIVATGASVFWDVLMTSPDWQMGDWGPQRAVLAHAMPSLPGWHAPVWNHAVGTGDAPLELYPSLAYYVVGHVALALGLAGDLPRAFMITAVVVHVGIAAATALIATRVAPKPIALLVGVAALVDLGATAQGGTVGLFRWALLHSALALALFSAAVACVLAAIARPRLWVSATIWATVALACIAHPVGLIGALVLALALALTALLAADVPPRRPLAALGHVLLGAALGAFAWMPLAERILLYGQHFPVRSLASSELLENILTVPVPSTAFAALVYTGYFGILVGLFSRRAAPTFIAAAAFALLVGLTDAPYVALGLEPGLGAARLASERLAQLSRPLVAAAAAYGLAIVAGHAVRAWRGAKPTQRLVAAAVLGLVGASVLRALPSEWRDTADRAAEQARWYAPDPDGRAKLEAWARARVAEQRPDSYARAVFLETTHEHFHLTAETGLPSFHMTAEPDLLLRERIEDLSPASLRRFDVRWAIGIGASPEIGDPATEQAIGDYRVREIPAWDGQFARIERGAGTVRVTRLDDTAVEVELTGTTEPALVALGTGYYPRWRAHHASGADEPVFALPTIAGGKLHVVSAWLAPGRTIFTCDGPLPSDGKGRLLSVFALLLAIAGSVAWSRRRWRVRILRRIARLPVARWGAIALRYGVPAFVIALVVKGCLDDRRPANALALGAGIRSTAEVKARSAGGPWQTCDYHRVSATYECAGIATFSDVSANLLNDELPSWDFATPAIRAVPLAPYVDIQIRLRAKLEGTYWAAARGGTVDLVTDDDAPRTFSGEHFTFDRPTRRVTLRASLGDGPWVFTMVRKSTLVPPRPFLDGPPDAAPAAVRAIH